jgi:hypothetical protein
MIPIILHDYPSGATELRAYPSDIIPTVGNWAMYKVPMTEGSAELLGTYSAEVDPTVSLYWVVFASDTAPGSYQSKLRDVLFDISSEYIASEVLKIPRASTANDGGDTLTETRNVVYDSIGTLIETKAIT